MALSVLLSVYCKENPVYLKQALDSVFHQTKVPDEVLLIKDGPLTKELDTVISNFEQTYPYFHSYQMKENVQLGRALAKGVELCRGDIIARMDTDDVALPKRLEKEYDYLLKHPEVSVVGGWIQEFNDEGTADKIKQMPTTNEEIRKYGKVRNPMNHMTVMFRKADVMEAGNYRHFPLLEDYDLWSRMMVMGKKFYNLQEIMVNMRISPEIYGRRGGKSYFQCHIKLRKVQYKLGWLTGLQYVIMIISTFIMTMQPSFLRKIAYQRFLRKK